MSEVESPSGTPDVAASGENQDKPNQQPNESGGQKDSVSYDSHLKLLNEKKSLQANYQKEKEMREKLEQERLEKEGKLSELVESLRGENQKLKSQNTQVVSNFAYKSVSSQLREEAAKLGCLNPTALAKLVDLDSFDVDTETFSVSEAQLKSAIDGVRTENPWLFGKASPKINNSNPKVESSNEKPSKKLSDMSQEDLLKAWQKVQR